MGRIMRPGGMPPDKDMGRVAAMLGDVVPQPGQRIGDILDAGWEQVVRCQTIADAGKDDPVRGERRPQEIQVLLVAAGPSAAMCHCEDGAGRLFGRLQGDRLVGVLTIADLRQGDPLTAARDVLDVGKRGLADRLLRRVVLGPHGARARPKGLFRRRGCLRARVGLLPGGEGERHVERRAVGIGQRRGARRV